MEVGSNYPSQNQDLVGQDHDHIVKEKLEITIPLDEYIDKQCAEDQYDGFRYYDAKYCLYEQCLIIKIWLMWWMWWRWWL